MTQQNEESEVNLDLIGSNHDECRRFTLRVGMCVYPDLLSDLVNRVDDLGLIDHAEKELISRLWDVIGEVPRGHIDDWRDVANSILSLNINASEPMDTRMAMRIGNAILRRVEKEQSESVAGPIQWSNFRSPKEWLTVFHRLGFAIGARTFVRRRQEGVFREHPDSKTKRVSLDISTLPKGYSDQM